MYKRYGGPIFGYCLSQLRSREEAEDAVQQTFLNALRGLQRGTETRAEQAWLFKIAHNVCMARRTSSGRRLRLETPNDFEVLQEIIPSPTRGDALELIGIEEALEAMPENQRRAILLREWQGLSYREIASELGLSQSSIEMLIFRARRTLAAALEKPEFPKSQLARLRNAIGVGPLVAAVKSFLAGSVAVKTVAVTVAVGTVGVTATELEHHRLLPKHLGAAAAATTPARIPAHERLGSTSGSLVTAAAVGQARDAETVQQVFAARHGVGSLHEGRAVSAPVAATIALVAPPRAAPSVEALAAPAPPVAGHDRQNGNVDNATQQPVYQQPSTLPSLAEQPGSQQSGSQQGPERSKTVPPPAAGGGNDDAEDDHAKAAPVAGGNKGGNDDGRRQDVAKPSSPPAGNSDKNNDKATEKQQERGKATSQGDHESDKHDGSRQEILSAQASVPVVPTQPQVAQPQPVQPQPVQLQVAQPQPVQPQPAQPQSAPADRETHGSQGDRSSKGKGGDGKSRDESDD